MRHERFIALCACAIVCLAAACHASDSLSADLALDYSSAKTSYVNPMDGTTPAYKFKATNAGSSDFIIHINPYCNGGSALFAPQGDVSLAPGESMWIKVFLEGMRCGYDEYTPQTVNLSVDVQICDNNPENTYSETNCLDVNKTALVEIVDQDTLAGDVLISGETYDGEGNVLPGVTLEIGGYGKRITLSSDSQGEFSHSFAVSDGYIVVASKTGYHSATLEIDGSNVANPYRINLSANENPLTVSSSSYRSLAGSIGFWKSASTSDSGGILLMNGMENWADQYLKNQSKLYLLNTSTGNVVWTHEMGWESWSADISGDGRYAVYATSFSNLDRDTFPAGYVNHVDLLNASTGELIWRKNVTVENFPDSTTGEMYSRGVRISHNNEYVLAHVESDYIYLLNRTDGSVLWSYGSSQNVREIIFSADDAYVYVSCGSGWLYKLRVSDGALMWKTWTGSWAYVNGMDMSSDGRYICTAVKGGVLSIVDADTGDVAYSTDIHGFTCTCRFSPDGTRLAVGSAGNEGLILMNLSGETIWRASLTDPRDIRFSGDGRLLFTSGGEVFDAEYGTRVHDILPGSDRDASIGWVNPDATRFIWAARDVSNEGSIYEVYTLQTSTTSTTTASTSTTSTTTTSSAPTSTTLPGECALAGDEAPCGEISLTEVIDYITAWTQGNASLGDVINLISAWAEG